MIKEKIEIEELRTWGYLEERFLDVLNKEYNLNEAIEDIKSFRNTEDYTGTNKKFMKKEMKSNMGRQ